MGISSLQCNFFLKTFASLFYRQPNLQPRRTTLIHQGPPKRFSLHTDRKVLDNGKVRKWTYGKKRQQYTKQNVLVGETGVGKAEKNQEQLDSVKSRCSTPSN